jgi:hypothetical protein
MSMTTMRVYDEILSVNANWSASLPARWHQGSAQPHTPIQKNDKPATSREADCSQNS